MDEAEPLDNDRQTEEDDPSEAVGAAHGHGAVDIFVSYRVRPDEPLAGELKALLEATIEPRPRVFVSGLGGLRASADSYREQLRVAARTARAYVALISRASVEREWIFFEAGAAFGRGVLYAPVLIDLAPSELPSSIGGYQAINAKDQPRMLELIEDVAKSIGAQPKSLFGRRYPRFAKAIDAYGKDERHTELTGFDLAVHLESLGKKREAAELFDELIKSAETPESRANLSITRLVFTQSALKNLPHLLESQPQEVKETATWKLWMGVHETNPLKAVKLLAEATAGNLNSSQQRWALMSLTRSEFELGHTKAATARLLVALSSEDRHLRADAAQALASQLESLGTISRLLLLIESTLDPTVEHLTAAIQHARHHRFTSIALQLSSTCVAKSTGGGGVLERGLTRLQAGLNSLAFADYRTAAQAGVSVAKSNMAWMLNGGPVPEAGLEILRAHSGEFDADDPGSPYAARAALERSVEAERISERKLCAAGDRAIKAIHRILDAWRLEGTGGSPHQFWMAGTRSGTIAVSFTPATAVRFGGTTFPTEPVPPFERLFAVNLPNSVRMLILAKDAPEAVAFADLENGGYVEWLELNPVDRSFFELSIATSDGAAIGPSTPMLGTGSSPST